MEVAAAVLERALGDEAFAALPREIGASDVYQMTEQQAEAVVRLQLGQLAALERDEILKEYSDLREQILGYEAALSDERTSSPSIRTDLEEMRDKYGDDRRTEIRATTVGDVDMRRPDRRGRSTPSRISHNGYIKRLPLNTYRVQHRGGKGVSGGAPRRRLHRAFLRRLDARLPALLHQPRPGLLAEGVQHSRSIAAPAPGRAIANVLSLKAEEKITSVIPVRTLRRGDCYLLMAHAAAAWSRRPPLMEYSRPQAGRHHRHQPGRRRHAHRRGADASRATRSCLSTSKGMAIRFDESRCPADGPQHPRREGHQL